MKVGPIKIYLLCATDSMLFQMQLLDDKGMGTIFDSFFFYLGEINFQIDSLCHSLFLLRFCDASFKDFLCRFILCHCLCWICCSYFCIYIPQRNNT